MYVCTLYVCTCIYSNLTNWFFYWKEVFLLHFIRELFNAHDKLGNKCVTMWVMSRANALEDVQDPRVFQGSHMLRVHTIVDVIQIPLHKDTINKSHCVTSDIKMSRWESKGVYYQRWMCTRRSISALVGEDALSLAVTAPSCPSSSSSSTPVPWLCVSTQMYPYFYGICITYSMSLTKALLNCSRCFLGLENDEPAVCDRWCFVPGRSDVCPLLELGVSWGCGSHDRLRGRFMPISTAEVIGIPNIFPSCYVVYLRGLHVGLYTMLACRRRLSICCREWWGPSRFP